MHSARQKRGPTSDRLGVLRIRRSWVRRLRSGNLGAVRNGKQGSTGRGLRCTGLQLAVRGGGRFARLRGPPRCDRAKRFRLFQANDALIGNLPAKIFAAGYWTATKLPRNAE